MHKVDIPSHAKPQSTSSSGSVAASASAGNLRRVKSTWGAEARERIGNYFGNRRLRKLASAVQTSDQDVGAVSGRRSDELITDLSRILMVVERDMQQGAADQIDQLFHAMLRENIRRLVVVQQSMSATSGA